jgi:hypothetical protein
MKRGSCRSGRNIRQSFKTIRNKFRQEFPDDPQYTTRRRQALPPRQAWQKLQKGLCDYLAGNDPGPIVFRLQRTKKASETYPLKLTQQQRERMIHCPRIKNKVKERLKAFRKWREPFDPEAFNAKDVTREMRKVKP